jgi:serine/threonine protein kinase/tetratricopeptide (TPR) repeat protein
MTTFSPGLCDSIAGVLDEPTPCPHCQSSSHIAGGLCVGCLLEAGLDPADDAGSETLTDILAEVRLPDQNWRLGNYEILEEIGRGGMGVIYRARQRHSRRIVAVKRVLSYHADSRETLARFRREAQAAASLDHPNILPIFEVSESEDGLPFFSMKFAPGGTLQQVAPALRKEPRQCVALVAKITRAVQYAHSRGILHRDLKPGNILLDARGEPLVSDFGLAKWLDTASDLTRTLTIFGTPGYIAPEQASAAAAELKPTADIYSLGAILFDLLAGRPPFLGAHALSVIRQAAESPAPKLRSLSKLADRDLETICSRCLYREPKLRYPSAHDLAEDLERWLEGRSIVARPVMPPVRLWRWSRRNPRLAVAASLCLVLAGLAIGWGLQNRGLSETVRRDALAAHSIAVFPLLDLDAVSTTSPQAVGATKQLLNVLSESSTVQARAFSQAKAENAHFSWRESDLRRAVLNFGTRALLLGTIRRDGAEVKTVLNVIDATNGRLLAQRVFTLAQSNSPILFSSRIDEMISAEWAQNSSSSEPRYLRAEVFSSTKSELARNYLLAGDDLFGRRSTEDIDRAIECYRKAVSADPSCALALADLASANAMRVQLKMDAAALADGERMAKRALELDPLLAEGHRAKAVCHYLSGQFPEAIEEATRAFELNPTYQRAVGLLGVIATEMGRPDLALRWLYWGQRLQNQPGDYEANIATALMLLGKDTESEAALHDGAQFRPDLPYPDIRLAILRMEQGRFEEAESLARTVSERFPSNIEATQALAETLLFAGRTEQAEQLYRKLLERDRHSGLFMSGLSYLSAAGWICLQSGRESEGRALLSEAEKDDQHFLTMAPKHPQHLYSLAANAAALGKAEEALALLNKAVHAGWIDHRYTRLDPRFGSLRKQTEFEQLLAVIVKNIEEMGRQGPAEKFADNN